MQLKEELESIEAEAGSMKAATPGAVMEYFKLQAVRANFLFSHGDLIWADF